MEERRKVAVIIVTYNAMPYLADCLGTLKDMDHGDVDVEVMVVENASKDGTLAEIKAKYGWVTLIEPGKNLGFAGGNNVAMGNAVARGFEYVYLLNQDTRPMQGFVAEAVRVAEADGGIAAAQSLILLSPDEDLINSTGNAIHFLGFGYCEDYRRRIDAWSPKGDGEIAYASGAGVLYRCSALKKVGMFDETLFMYHEDLDLGWRFRLAGYRNVLAPRSVIHHKYEFSRSIGKWYYMERNRYVVLLKNLRTWSFIVLLPWLVGMDVMLTLSAVRGGWVGKKLSAMMYFMDPRVWTHIFRERDRVAKIRARSDREVMRIFTAEISHQETESPFIAMVANPLMRAAWAVSRTLIV